MAKKDYHYAVRLRIQADIFALSNKQRNELKITGTGAVVQRYFD
jgi:hypothetical protein